MGTAFGQRPVWSKSVTTLVIWSLKKRNRHIGPDPWMGFPDVWFIWAVTPSSTIHDDPGVNDEELQQDEHTVGVELSTVSPLTASVVDDELQEEECQTVG